MSHPYLDKNGDLRIPMDSDKEFRWWQGIPWVSGDVAAMQAADALQHERFENARRVAAEDAGLARQKGAA